MCPHRLKNFFEARHGLAVDGGLLILLSDALRRLLQFGIGLARVDLQLEEGEEDRQDKNDRQRDVTDVGCGKDFGIALVPLVEPLEMFVYCFLKILVGF